jgi:hypothetical protein
MIEEMQWALTICFVLYLIASIGEKLRRPRK